MDSYLSIWEFIEIQMNNNMKKLYYHLKTLLTWSPAPPHTLMSKIIKSGVLISGKPSATFNPVYIPNVPKRKADFLSLTYGLASLNLSGWFKKWFVSYPSQAHSAIKTLPRIWSWVSHFCIWGSKGLLAHPTSIPTITQTSLCI